MRARHIPENDCSAESMMTIRLWKENEWGDGLPGRD